MIAFDTNILFHSINRGSSEYEKARAFLSRLPADPGSVAIRELVLIELYVLLRNPVLIEKPLSAHAAVSLIEPFRRHPLWELIDQPGRSSNVMDRVWTAASAAQFPGRAIFDARLAFTLLSSGVTEFATCNVSHFTTFGFERVWNPLTGS